MVTQNSLRTSDEKQAFCENELNTSGLNKCLKQIKFFNFYSSRAHLLLSHNLSTMICTPIQIKNKKKCLKISTLIRFLIVINK